MRAFITGVGSGIGRETCLTFLANGWDVIGLLRNRSQGEILGNDVKKLEGTLQLIYADLSSNGFIEEVKSGLDLNKIDSINALINVAGILNPIELNDFEEASINMVLTVNFVAPALLIRALTPFLANQKNSNILNITSMSGFQGSVRFPGLSIYGASKAALSSLSESLSVELDSQNIAINALAIGSVNTEMLNEAFPEFKAPVEANEMAEYIYSFSTHGYKFYNGKTLSVAVTNP
jgi:NAD(P)-dependent dehydrogenase (short-subunit alcohol dehydrogenase family)